MSPVWYGPFYGNLSKFKNEKMWWIFFHSPLFIFSRGALIIYLFIGFRFLTPKDLKGLGSIELDENHLSSKWLNGNRRGQRRLKMCSKRLIRFRFMSPKVLKRSNRLIGRNRANWKSPELKRLNENRRG